MVKGGVIIYTYKALNYKTDYGSDNYLTSSGDFYTLYSNLRVQATTVNGSINTSNAILLFTYSNYNAYVVKRNSTTMCLAWVEGSKVVYQTFTSPPSYTNYSSGNAYISLVGLYYNQDNVPDYNNYGFFIHDHDVPIAESNTNKWKKDDRSAHWSLFNFSISGLADATGQSASEIINNIAVDTDEGIFVEKEDNNGVPYSKEDTGGEYVDYTSTPIDIPSDPSIGIIDTGFLNVYAPTTGELTSFGSDLFPEFTSTSPSAGADTLESIANALANISNNVIPFINMYINNTLINYIIDCHIIPFVPTVGNKEGIKVAWKTFNQRANKVSSDYITVDLGTLTIPESFKSFLDYQTRLKLYLPFVGYVDIPTTYFMGGTIHVIYKANVIDGSFTAFVKGSNGHGLNAETLLGQYGGSCCVHIPITGANYSSTISNLTSAVMQGASGNIAGGIGSAISSIANLPNPQMSNSYSGSSAFMGGRTPYLVVERANQNYPKNYNNLKGRPSAIFMKCNKISGYTKANEILCNQMEGVTASELELLNEKLKDGIYFN